MNAMNCFIFWNNKTMRTQEILSITALSALGLCLLCGLAKMAMKSNEAKKGCDKACGILVFAAVVLIAVSQLLEEIDEKLELGKKDCNQFWVQGDDKAVITSFMGSGMKQFGPLPPLPSGLTKCYDSDCTNKNPCDKDYIIGNCLGDFTDSYFWPCKTDKSSDVPSYPFPPPSLPAALCCTTSAQQPFCESGKKIDPKTGACD